MKCRACGFDDGATRGDALAWLASLAVEEGLTVDEFAAGCRAIFRLAELHRVAKASDRDRAIAQALSPLLDPEGREPTPTG